MVRLDPDIADPFEIVIGTYEQYLLGYKVENIVNEYKMERSFAMHSHLGSVRTVAGNKHYLASGGADDSVYLYDMRYRVESGRLMHHNDTVNCIAFTPEASHLFTCSNDGTIAAIRCGNWQVEKHWQKPHKGFPVNTLAIHPTGKIALSAGADGILRTWNLVKGRQAYATNLVPRLKLDAKNVTVLKWSPNGEKYLLAVNHRIDIYSVELAGIDNEIRFDSKIICVEFLKDDLIAVGLENGQIKFYDLEKSVQTVEAIAHNIRVKCIAFKDDLLVTASSAGEIKLWRYSKHKLDMLQKVNCGARITCLSLAMPSKSLVNKTEIKLEDEVEVKKKKKFRLRQEVIIEDEGSWEVTSIERPQSKSSKKKINKRRSIEEISDTHISPSKKNKPTVNEHIASAKKRERISEGDNFADDTLKKKKVITNEAGNDKTVIKKRKEKSVQREERDGKCFKKVKKSVEPANVSNIVTKKLKSKPLQLAENDDSPPTKKKKRMIPEENSTLLKKKKKKQ